METSSRGRKLTPKIAIDLGDLTGFWAATAQKRRLRYTETHRKQLRRTAGARTRAVRERQLRRDGVTARRAAAAAAWTPEKQQTLNDWLDAADESDSESDSEDDDDGAGDLSAGNGEADSGGDSDEEAVARDAGTPAELLCRAAASGLAPRHELLEPVAVDTSNPLAAVTPDAASELKILPNIQRGWSVRPRRWYACRAARH